MCVVCYANNVIYHRLAIAEWHKSCSIFLFSAGHLLANGNKQWSNYTCSYVLIANLFMVYGLFGFKWPFIVAGQHTTHEYSNIGGVHYQPDMVPAGRSTVLLRPAP